MVLRAPSLRGGDVRCDATLGGHTYGHSPCADGPDARGPPPPTLPLPAAARRGPHRCPLPRALGRLDAPHWGMPLCHGVAALALGHRSRLWHGPLHADNATHVPQAHHDPSLCASTPLCFAPPVARPLPAAGRGLSTLVHPLPSFGRIEAVPHRGGCIAWSAEGRGAQRRGRDAPTLPPLSPARPGDRGGAGEGRLPARRNTAVQ